MLRIPFDDFVPTSTIDVPAGASIQAAFDKAVPGCLIALHAGTYMETPKLNKDGTPDAPIIIKSVDGAGAAIIKAPTNPTRKSVVTGLGRKCVVLDGLAVDASSICQNGIQFGLSGTDPTQLDRYVADIVIRNCSSIYAVEDNIKISQGDRIWVIDNVCRISKSDQNIDFLAVNDSVIARNMLDQGGRIGGPPALIVKGGCERVLAARNRIIGSKAAGMSLGGYCDLSVYSRPGSTCQAKTCWAIKNYIANQNGPAFQFLGAQDCAAWENYFGLGYLGKPIVTITDDNYAHPSTNCTCERNVFQRSSNSWAPVPANNSYANCPPGKVPYNRNTYDNIWPRLDSTGPASGPVLYGMPTAGSTVGTYEDIPPDAIGEPEEDQPDQNQ
jgi:serralysin